MYSKCTGNTEMKLKIVEVALSDRKQTRSEATETNMYCIIIF